MQDDPFIKDFLDQSDLTYYTPRTITDPELLWEQIRKIRKQHYAINDGEHYEDVAAVAVPIRERTGRITTGVSLAYPRHIVTEGRISNEDLIPLAHEIAREIMERTGTAG